MIIIKIETDNAAFEESCSVELARILKVMVYDLETKGKLAQSYKDINGNKVVSVGKRYV